MKKQIRNLITDIKAKTYRFENTLEELKGSKRTRTMNSIKNKLSELYIIRDLLFENYSNEDFDLKLFTQLFTSGNTKKIIKTFKEE